MSHDEAKIATERQPKITPLRCLTGGSIAGGLAIAAYLLTISIANTYAHKPINFNNPIAINIAVTVRTLVVGITALAACVFAMVTLGLFALAIKLILEKGKQQVNSSES
jgi:hypothetical protein